MGFDRAIVYRFGQIYLERYGETIEIMIVDERRCLRWVLGEFGARDFLVTFTELLTQLYEDKYKAKVEEMSRLQEMIETYKNQGWRTEDEEKKLKALEEKATEYALKRDFLKKLIEDFKKVLCGD